MESSTAIGFPPTTIAVFVGLAIIALAIDLLTHNKDKPVTLANASMWSIFWVMISMAFAGYLYAVHGPETASLFVTGYALEKVLSVDNLFVFMAIFAWFKIPDGLRHRVLYWGIIGAIVFRGIFVAIGTGLLAFGPWVEIIFAAIVAWTAVMMLRAGGDDDEDVDYSQHIAYRYGSKMFPAWPKLHGHDFFVKRSVLQEELKKPENKSMTLAEKGVWFSTPLFLCVVVVEISDILFAFDSVPAVIAVSKEPLIVYSAMMFAILGLRTMYFVLEALKRYLVHLEKSVIALLFFIAGKLALNATNHLFHHGYSIDPNTSLAVVMVVLALGIVASVLFPGDEVKAEENA
ncbi:TerC/Alx family metal homeostasis membrane protein [Pseudomonas sp.]|uniref:TerC/Alx family metal homeostasis membrane protein n=1 Tax=Pseudomonas sp. TaxID=306 RepID=UPI00299F0545|nr:TerC/Alx family metal homeostasis membrane protein [Pseudomonas sp.]MDX1367429.1 TerC/Alx family metal homeostasis membrane protein [Pseudomonas sp.]